MEQIQPIRVLIVDDHVVVRQGIRLLVSTEPAIQIVGEANDGGEAVCQAKRLLPDIILMDLVMPPEHGIKPIARIKQDHPQIKIIALTTFLDNLKISEALRAGAEGCLIKDGDGQAILQAIQAVRRGESLLHPRFTRKLPETRLNTADGILM
jgi:DNA-binding NarL/FixJ family response regulator